MTSKTSPATGHQGPAAIRRAGSDKLAFTLLFLVIVGAAAFSIPRAIASNGPTVPIAVVIEYVSVDTETETLTVFGRNFDIGPWGYAEVNLLDFSSLTVTDHSGESITAELPGVSTLPGSFVLTVQTGDGLDYFDAHPVVLGDADPEPLVQQLLMRGFDLSIGEDPDEVELIIAGYNFMNGDWPPTVTLAGKPLTVDTEKSDEYQLVVYAPSAALEVADDTLLQVRTGTETSNYDAMLIHGTPPEPTDPYDGSEICNEVGVCYKKGPPRTNLCSSHPRYFELTRDYELKMSYFYYLKENNVSDFNLPEMAKRYQEYFPDIPRDVDAYFALMTKLPDVPFEKNLDKGYKWDFISLVREGTGPDAVFPTLKIRKGYRWDGTTRPCRRFANELRSGLIHDAMYDLIRSEAIPWKDGYTGARKRQRDRDNMNNRELADMMFYWTHMQDRKVVPSKTVHNPDGTYYTLQHDGMRRASFHIEKGAEWRFHTKAAADVSAPGAAFGVDADGNRQVTLSCALPDDVVQFDASASRPITDSPIASTHGPNNLHETTWEWLLNDAPFIAMKKNTIGQVLDRDQLVSSVSVGTIWSNPAWQEAPGNLVTLLIDSGKGDPLSEILALLGIQPFFANDDKVALIIEKDTEPPVITGISEPIIAWPPNHKYRTFTPRDFVFSVTDNCTVMSIDDLTIHHVTSNEPDNATGDGNTINDIVIATDGRSVDLRIERQGEGGNGRVYTVYVEAVDESLNSAISAFEVCVPHDRGRDTTCPAGSADVSNPGSAPPAATSPPQPSVDNKGSTESGGGSIGWTLLGVLLMMARRKRL